MKASSVFYKTSGKKKNMSRTSSLIKAVTELKTFGPDFFES